MFVCFHITIVFFQCNADHRDSHVLTHPCPHRRSSDLIYGLNSAEWLEAALAAYKIRAVPVNVNYRYVADELRYLFDNADLKALVHDRGLAPRVLAVRSEEHTSELQSLMRISYAVY